MLIRFRRRSCLSWSRICDRKQTKGETDTERDDRHRVIRGRNCVVYAPLIMQLGHSSNIQCCAPFSVHITKSSVYARNKNDIR